MQDLKMIRFVTGNFSQLQGLRMVPVGLMVLLVSFWANTLGSHKGSLLVPLVLFGASILAYLLVDRYYSRTYGRVRQDRKLWRKDMFLGLAGAILALVAFWVEVIFRFQYSLVGLAVVAGLIADYFRANWRLGWRELWYYPVMAVVMLVLSLAPLIAGAEFWPSIGVKMPVYGILMAAGIMIVLIGFWSHSYLAHTLTTLMENRNGECI